MVGLDAYMMIRFLNIHCRVSAFLAVCGLCILLPIYYTHKDGTSSPFSWANFTLANIPNNSQMFWMPVLFSYIFSAYYCRLMQKEYVLHI